MCQLCDDVKARGQSILSLLIMLTSPSEGRIHPFRRNAIASLKIASATNTVRRALTFLSPPKFHVVIFTSDAKFRSLQNKHNYFFLNFPDVPKMCVLMTER